MDWEVVLPRFAQVLTPRGMCAVLGADQLPTPWDAELWPLRQHYSVIPNWQPFNPIQELEKRGLFRQVGVERTEPVLFVQTLDDYIESFHGRAAFSRARMTAESAAAFDSEVRALVSRYSADRVELQLVTEVVWGIPLHPGRVVSGKQGQDHPL
jgi:hypothetical protein